MRKVRVYYAEDDGGSLLVSPVDPDIKTSLRRALTYLEKAHGIRAQKVCLLFVLLSLKHVCSQCLNLNCWQVSLQALRKSGPIWLARMKSRSGSRFAQELSNNEVSFQEYRLCLIVLQIRY